MLCEEEGSMYNKKSSGDDSAARSHWNITTMVWVHLSPKLFSIIN